MAKDKDKIIEAATEHIELSAVLGRFFALVHDPPALPNHLVSDRRERNANPMTQTDTPTCHPIEAVVDVTVEVTWPNYILHPPCRKKGETHEAYFKRKERALQEWADEINDHFRDHRSRDADVLSVAKYRKTLCSACGREWELWDEEGQPQTCAGCGAVYAPETEKGEGEATS